MMVCWISGQPQHRTSDDKGSVKWLVSGEMWNELENHQRTSSLFWIDMLWIICFGSLGDQDVKLENRESYMFVRVHDYIGTMTLVHLLLAFLSESLSSRKIWRLVLLVAGWWDSSWLLDKPATKVWKVEYSVSSNRSQIIFSMFVTCIWYICICTYIYISIYT